MRSEIDANPENDRSEPVSTTDQSNNELTWVVGSPNNKFVRSLEGTFSFMTFIVGKQVKNIAKEMKNAEKVFNANRS